MATIRRNGLSGSSQIGEVTIARTYGDIAPYYRTRVEESF